VASLKGYSAPRSPEGRSSLVPTPPWHYVGDMLVIEFWADADAAAAVLPAPLEPHPDGGRAAAMFMDWQSCSDGGEELMDPARAQYREFFITVNALYEGEEVAYCPYIWVDRDFALARGWIQGFPKKLGSIHMTRLFPVGKATPRLEPGARFGATCTANGRQIARAVVTLEHVSEGGPTVNDPPMHNTRHFPAASGTRPDVFELVRAGGYDRDATEIWEGSAELRLFDDTLEDLQAIAPRELLRGYRFSFGYTVDGVEVVAQHDREGAT
jgi:acetoacetate decarboxylase